MYSYNVMRCDHLLSELVFNNAIKNISEDRAAKVLTYKNAKSRVESLGATLALEKLLEACKISKPFSYMYSENGKPLLRGENMPYISLTHSDLYSAAVVSDVAVGIDIERVKTYNPKIVERFFTSKDKAIMASITEDIKDEMFYKIWTYKEAIAKALDIPVAHILDKISYGQREYEGRYFATDHAFMDGFVITIVEERLENS